MTLMGSNSKEVVDVHGEVQTPTKCAGDLHSDFHIQREIAGFVLTEGRYAPAKMIARHDHELASVTIVLAGGYQEGFGRRSRLCEPGAVIVHPEGEHHQEVHDPVHVKLLTIEIGAGYVQTLRPAIGTFDEAWHRTDYAVAALAYRLCAEVSRSDDMSALLIESAILEILAILDNTRLAETCSASWLPRVRDLLAAEFHRPPTMTQMSELAGVHPVHLARAFRRRFGCSVGAYVRRLQVGKAAIMLEDQTYTLSSVAHETGFSDQSHMTRLLRAETGLTPGAWRRRRTAVQQQ
jgi:AraC family transcriptional regulator